MPPRTAAPKNPPRLRSESVHERLRTMILTGELSAGDPLPSERVLSESHRVNRHAVREAIKRLQQAGLVQVSQGGATRVRDWRTTGGLDLLTDVTHSDGPVPLLVAIAEMRATIGADAARLCALRGPTELVAELPALARALPMPADLRRFEPRLRAYEAFWSRIVEGSGNLAYRLAFNSLVSARGGGSLDPQVFAAEVDVARTAVTPLALAIAARDATRACDLARTVLERPLRGSSSAR